jgi:hypothetical protein
MATNFSPVFALVPEMANAKITATTTDKSGATTTNIVDLVTAPADGCKVSQIRLKFSGISAAGLLLVFITDTTGTVLNLYTEAVFTAVTSSTVVAAFETVLNFSDLNLKSGQIIKVGATSVSSPIHLTASVGYFS